jgi:hypothetical protein
MKAILFLAATLAMISPAEASQPFKDNAGIIHIQGFTPSQKILIFNGDTELVRRPKANKCGLLTIPIPIGHAAYGENLVIAGTYINTFSVPTEPVPFCNRVNGIHSLSSQPSGAFKTPEGLIVISGLTPSMSYEVVYLGLLNHKAYRANKCGHIKFPAPLTGAFKVASPTTEFYSVSGLSESLPEICISGQRFAPSIP